MHIAEEEEEEEICIPLREKDWNDARQRSRTHSQIGKSAVCESTTHAHGSSPTGSRLVRRS